MKGKESVLNICEQRSNSFDEEKESELAIFDQKSNCLDEIKGF
jgi:hypothetical protein